MSKLTGLWGHTDFLKLWAGQTLSALSSNVTDLALPLIAALVLHASAFEMGLLSTVATLPDLLLGLFAGVWADRVRRRPIMIAADASRALLLLSVPVAAVFHMMTIWQLYAVLFLTGACATFFDVANMSYLPSLVGREHLVSANSKLVASTSFARAVGPGLAGGLIQLLTAPIAIVADTLSLIVSAVLVFTVRSREPERASDGRHDSVWREIVAGLRTLYDESSSRRPLDALVGQCRHALRPRSSRTPTSRCRCATADHPGPARGSRQGAGRAAIGTRAARSSRPRLQERLHAPP